MCVCCAKNNRKWYGGGGRAVGLPFLLIASQLNLSSSSSSSSAADRSTKEWMTILLLSTWQQEMWKKKINAAWRKRDSLVVRHLILSKMPNRDETKKERTKKKKRNKILVNPSLTRTITSKPTQHMLLAKIVPGLNLHIKERRDDTKEELSYRL